MRADSPTLSRPQLWQTGLILVFTGWVMGVLDWLRPVSAALDVDDTLRRLQIEDVLADGRWYDLHLPQVSLPGDLAYESHWSRLVDLPYLALTQLLDVFLSTETALYISSAVIPPLLFAGFVWLVVLAVRDLLGRNPNLLEIAAMAALLSQIAYEFVPLRIDHHNMQMLCLAGVARGLSLKTPRFAGVVCGIATALSITIGLETVPVLGVLITGLGLTAAFNNSAAHRLSAFGASLGATSLISATVFLGPSSMFSTACDAFSGTYLFTLTLGGGMLALLPLLWRHPVFTGAAAAARRLFSLGLCGTALAVGSAFLFPQCLAGPYHMIDPVSRAFWLDNVTQEYATYMIAGMPSLFGRGLLMVALVPACLIATLLAGFSTLHSEDTRDGRRILMAMAALAVVFGIFTIRNVPLAYTFGLLLLPLAIQYLTLNKETLKWAASGVASLICVFTVAGWLTAPPHTGELTAYDLNAGDACTDDDLAAVRALPDGRALVTFALGLRLLDETDHIQVSAITFHRAAPGIREMADLYARNVPTTDDAFDAFDYVIVCRRDVDFAGAPQPVFRALVQGEDLPGLTRISDDTPGTVMVYQVDARN